MFKPSKKLSTSENHKLEILNSLLYAAPLSNDKYGKYVALTKKAGRKVRANW